MIEKFLIVSPYVYTQTGKFTFNFTCLYKGEPKRFSYVHSGQGCRLADSTFTELREAGVLEMYVMVSNVVAQLRMVVSRDFVRNAENLPNKAALLVCVEVEPARSAWLSPQSIRGVRGDEYGPIYPTGPIAYDLTTYGVFNSPSDQDLGNVWLPKSTCDEGYRGSSTTGGYGHSHLFTLADALPQIEPNCMTLYGTRTIKSLKELAGFTEWPPLSPAPAEAVPTPEWDAFPEVTELPSSVPSYMAEAPTVVEVEERPSVAGSDYKQLALAAFTGFVLGRI